MKLTFREAPESVRSALQMQFPFIVARSKVGAEIFADRSFTTDSFGPIPTYISDIGLVGGMQSPRKLGWRYLILHADKPVAVADFEATEQGGATLASIHYRAGAEHLFEALLIAKDCPGNACEVRLLMFPRLRLVTVWLFGRRSLYVIAGSLQDIPRTPLTRAELLAHIERKHEVNLVRRRITN